MALIASTAVVLGEGSTTQVYGTTRPGRVASVCSCLRGRGAEVGRGASDFTELQMRVSVTADIRSSRNLPRGASGICQSVLVSQGLHKAFVSVALVS